MFEIEIVDDGIAMSPFLQMTRKDLWQLYVLEK